jgi:succinate dehydrogenase / fumarate reductase, membrane anchor subunit
MLFFLAFFLIHLAVDPPHRYSAWHAWITGSGPRIATIVFFAALLAHAWVGLHVVITDYVHTIAVRIGLLLLMGLGLTTISVWVMQILWLRHG